MACLDSAPERSNSARASETPQVPVDVVKWNVLATKGFMEMTSGGKLIFFATGLSCESDNRYPRTNIKSVSQRNQ